MKEKARLIELLSVSVEYIRNCPDQIIHYDEADCDGYCLADDLETVLECLQDERED